MPRRSWRFARGVRWRLTIWVAAVLLVAEAVTFVVVYRDTGQQLRSQIERDLRGDTSQLYQSMRLSGAQTPAAISTAASRYVGGQSYRATSTLLWVEVPGAMTVSNHPELFGSQRVDPGESSTEQARENAMAHRLLIPVAGYSTQRLPDVGKVRLLERSATFGRVAVVLGAGEPLVVVESAQRGVARAFILAGALTFILALIASYVAGARVSAPLRRMARIAARVDAGDLEPRMPAAGASQDEVRVLADAFNHMLDRLGTAFARQREFVADASHELRTPLTVIRGQLEVLVAQENPSPEEIRRVERLLQSEVSRVARLVDDLLLLAQSDRADFLQLEPVDLAPFVSELWDGLTAIADRRFELGQIPHGVLNADPDRLAQALRNLVRNAIDHTAVGDGLVRLELAHEPPGRIRFTVIDDGPGIPATERARIFERFHRTDSARTRATGGAGLGLAIVRAIADAHHGEVRLAGSAAVRGARFELTLPGFVLSPSPGPVSAGAR